MLNCSSSNNGVEDALASSHMTTRGLVGIKEGNKIRFFYNHGDSYPSSMMIRLYDAIQKNPEQLKEDIESGKFTGSKTQIEKVDYLYHKYVYIIDFEKKLWSAYGSEFLEDTKGKHPVYWNNSNGRLNPLLEDVPFGMEVAVFPTGDGDATYIKVRKKKKRDDNMFVLYDGKEYYLAKDGKLLSQSKDKDKLMMIAVADAI